MNMSGRHVKNWIKIADRVRLIRKRRSISQEKLSKISNVSLGSIKDLKQQDRFHCYR